RAIRDEGRADVEVQARNRRSALEVTPARRTVLLLRGIGLPAFLFEAAFDAPARGSRVPVEDEVVVLGRVRHVTGDAHVTWRTRPRTTTSSSTGTRLPRAGA